MSTPKDEGNQSDDREQEASICSPDCGCNPAAKTGKMRWVIGAIVLLAAGVMVVRAMSKTDATAAQKPVPAFAAPAASPTQAAEAKSAIDSSTTVQAEENTVGTMIGALAELNDVAAKTDVVFIFLPGKEPATGIPPSKPIKEAVRMIEEKAGKKCGIFTLKPGSRDYAQIAAQMSVPGVLAMVKGGGTSAVSGEITDTKLVQGFVSASSAGGCGSGGCSPASAGCK